MLTTSSCHSVIYNIHDIIIYLLYTCNYMYMYNQLLVLFLVAFPPVVTIDEFDVIPLGDSVSLVCSAVGSEPYNFVWKTEKGLEISSNPTVVLEISDVSQYGIYTCEVTNSFGTGSATVEVTPPG